MNQQLSDKVRKLRKFDPAHDQKLTGLVDKLPLNHRAFWEAVEDGEEPGVAYAAHVGRPGIGDVAARAGASRLLGLPSFLAIKAHRTQIQAQSVALDAKDVMKQWVELALADPTEIVKTRRVNCRHCHGDGFRYRWRDADEWAEELAKAMDHNARVAQRRAAGQAAGEDKPLPDHAGGFGWRGNDKPNPDCPKCDGEGFADVFIADMDLVTGPARRLIASVEQTKDGVKVKMRDQDRALENIAKALTMFGERLEHSGPGGGPIPVAAAHFLLPTDPVEASRAYEDYIQGKVRG